MSDSARPRARENRQEQSENRLRADRVEIVIVNEIPAWIVLVALIGWIAPSPGEIARRVREAVRKVKRTRPMHRLLSLLLLLLLLSMTLLTCAPVAHAPQLMAPAL